MHFQCTQSRSECEFRERQTLSSFSPVQYVGESGCRWIGNGESRLWFEVWGKNFNTQQLNCPKVIVLEQTSSDISSVMFYWSFRWNICNQNLVKLKENIKWHQKNISCGWSLFSLFNCQKSLELLCTNTVYLFFLFLPYTVPASSNESFVHFRFLAPLHVVVNATGIVLCKTHGGAHVHVYSFWFF